MRDELAAKRRLARPGFPVYGAAISQLVQPARSNSAFIYALGKEKERKALLLPRALGRRSLREGVSRPRRQGKTSAQQDQRRQQEKQEGAEWWREQIALIDEAEAPLGEFLHVSKLLLSSIMVLSGYHSYRGHSWRKRKGTTT